MQANPKIEHIWQFPLIRVRRLLQSLMDFVLETKASFWDISLVSLENVIFAGDFYAVKQGFIYSAYLITCEDNSGRHLVSMPRDNGWLHIRDHSKMGCPLWTSVIFSWRTIIPHSWLHITAMIIGLCTGRGED